MKKNLLLLLFAAFALCGALNAQAGAQKWKLTDDAGQVAYVTIYPFTYSGTFNETDDSPGWWIGCEGGGSIRIPISGTIAKSDYGDSWTFTISLGGCGCTVQGQAEGNSIGSFPDASFVSGTYSMSSSCGMTNSQHNWIAEPM
ncbi:MAG: hypothetical protein HY064_13610 [Bacteroidetes bacterium]|nr:hypothetical protein [Bacteroidota bacterium]